MKNALSISPADVPSKGRSAKRPKEDSANRGELNGINIELTENGCIVRCSFDPETVDPKRPRYEQMMPEDEKYSFDDREKACEYVRTMLAGAADSEDEESSAKKKAPKGAKKDEE